MKHIINNLYIAAAALMATACGYSDEFRIDLDIEGLGTGQVEMVYYDGGIQKVTSHGVDNKVTLRGVSSSPALVEVFTLDHRPVATLVAANGDRLSVKADLENPFSAEVEGNEASEFISAFMRENAATLSRRDSESINRLIEKQIAANPSSRGTTALLMTMYDVRGNERVTDSLLNLLSTEARDITMIRNFSRTVNVLSSMTSNSIVRPMTLVCGRDSVTTFIPRRQSYGLIVFNTTRRPDSVYRLLRSMTDSVKKRRLAILELSLAPDSATWRRNIDGDSAKWDQAWTQGGAGAPAIRNLSITSMPFYIALDSTGRQLYRGSDPRAARDTIMHRINSLKSKK